MARYPDEYTYSSTQVTLTINGRGRERISRPLNPWTDVNEYSSDRMGTLPAGTGKLGYAVVAASGSGVFKCRAFNDNVDTDADYTIHWQSILPASWTVAVTVDGVSVSNGDTVSISAFSNADVEITITAHSSISEGDMANVVLSMQPDGEDTFENADSVIAIAVSKWLDEDDVKQEMEYLYNDEALFPPAATVSKDTLIGDWLTRAFIQVAECFDRSLYTEVFPRVEIANDWVLTYIRIHMLDRAIAYSIDGGSTYMQQRRLLEKKISNYVHDYGDA